MLCKENLKGLRLRIKIAANHKLSGKFKLLDSVSFIYKLTDMAYQNFMISLQLYLSIYSYTITAYNPPKNFSLDQLALQTVELKHVFILPKLQKQFCK